MSRAVLVLHTDALREKAIDWIRRLPKDSRVTFNKPQRTLPQNSRMWAMLGDVAEQVLWHGMKLTTESWKLIFLDALDHEMRIVPNLDGTGFVNLSRSSSELSVEEMTDLIELIFRFGANPDHPVEFHDPESIAAREAA